MIIFSSLFLTLYVKEIYYTEKKAGQYVQFIMLISVDHGPFISIGFIKCIHASERFHRFLFVNNEEGIDLLS